MTDNQCLDLMYGEVHSSRGHRVVLQTVKRAQISLQMAAKMPVHHMIKSWVSYKSDGQLHDGWKRRQILVMSCSCSAGKLSLKSFNLYAFSPQKIRDVAFLEADTDG